MFLSNPYTMCTQQFLKLQQYEKIRDSQSPCFSFKCVGEWSRLLCLRCVHRIYARERLFLEQPCYLAFRVR
jgi:hypothetical protein